MPKPATTCTIYEHAGEDPPRHLVPRLANLSVEDIDLEQNVAYIVG